MTGSVFVDTNVFVYSYASGEPEKQRRAVLVLDRLVDHDRGWTSTQVLGEMFRTLVERLRPPRAVADAVDDVAALARAWPVLPITPFVVLEAARGVRDHRLSYRDAQLWATARLNQIDRVVSEGFTHGRSIDGVRFVSPFGAGFDPAVL